MESHKDHRNILHTIEQWSIMTEGWGNVFFESTVNILIFYCSSVIGSYLKKSVPLFQISVLSAQPPPVRRQQPSGRGPAPAPAARGGGWKTKPPIPVPCR